MELQEKHRAFQKEIRDFIRENVIPLINEHEEKGTLPMPLIRKMGESGYMGIPFPKEYGGAGRDVQSYIIAVEEMSRVWGSMGITLAAHTSLGSYPIYKFGTAEQKKKFLSRLSSGQTLGAFGLTEPDAGSDAGSTRTVATLASDEYVINGSKIFITSALTGEIVTCTAVTDRDAGKKGISAIVVEKGTPGFSIGKKEDKLGLRASETVSLSFDECRVPKENMLGAPGDGFKIFMNTLDGGRISIGALALGLAQGALDCAVEYADCHNLLKGFENELTQEMIAEMTADVEASRRLVYHAACIEDAGGRYTREGAIAKYFASEASVRVASKAMSLIGLEGATSRYPIERIFRDTKLCTIGEGTSQVQCMVIAREMMAPRVKTGAS